MNFITSLLAGANLLRMNLQMMNNPSISNNQDEQKSDQQTDVPNDIGTQFIQQSLLQNLIMATQMQNANNQKGVPVQSKSKKISKRGNECGHQDKEHYAKGMCSNCYHKFGRNKKPQLCGHEKLYAQGLCQNCYINKYNQKRRTIENVDANQGEAPQPKQE